MKKLTFIFLSLLLISVNMTAQEEFTAKDSLEVVQKIDKQMIFLRHELDKKFADELQKGLMVEFSIDTARIERFAVEKINVDFSTAGMNDAITQLNDGYDKLMNKYYKKLMSGLDVADKEILKQAQRSWIQYRDNQVRLIRLLAKDKYSGGGTIQTNICAGEIMSLTKDRVIQLFLYLIR
jgi:Uncharacterized protein conserved in bacteria